ncbi:MAG: hypothetical protein ACFFCS_00690 [Candidatus Hodarchaeota archaeon]
MNQTKTNSLTIILKKFELLKNKLDLYGWNEKFDELFNEVYAETEQVIKTLFSEREKDNFNQETVLQYFVDETPQEEFKHQKDRLNACIAQIKAYIIRMELNSAISIEKKSISGAENDSISKVILLCEKFESVVRQLIPSRRRKEKGKPRPTIEMKDEYDAQDLFRALLSIFFDDIRPEEWNPSYAGSSSRMDFLLKNEKIVVEVKFTRETLKDKQVGEQLIIDITKYKQHAECKSMVCFIYDPNDFIDNPSTLENDLSKDWDGLPVKVIVSPKK